MRKLATVPQRSKVQFLDQESFETLTLSEDRTEVALECLIDDTIVELLKYNGNPISLELLMLVEFAGRRSTRPNPDIMKSLWQLSGKQDGASIFERFAREAVSGLYEGRRQS